MTSGATVKQVAESCFAYLHTELVSMSLGAEPSPSELQMTARRMEGIGFQVGQRLAERYTKDRPRFVDELEIIKFICKDFWIEIYGKQIDKLQTNNKGVFMLHDNRHRLLSRCSSSVERQPSARSTAALHAKFPSGLIRGALHGLGVAAAVGVDVSDLGVCQFTIKVQKENVVEQPKAS
mmetsp:Transcript_7674/g.23965  ORF Transcript_7674/g.23965 Transcript_7674/m.23965 type:complete len:179 (+) Transcript_7674:151-687(+)